MEDFSVATLLKVAAMAGAAIYAAGTFGARLDSVDRRLEKTDAKVEAVAESVFRIEGALNIRGKHAR